MRSVARARRRSSAQLAGSSRRSRRCSRRCPTCPTRAAAPGPRGRARARGRRAAALRLRAARPPRARGRDDRHGARGARLSGSRFAYLRGDLVMLELALVRWALREAARPRLRAGDPAGARARARAVRDGLPARHRAADLPPAGGRALPRRHLRGRRSPRCTTARSSRPSGCRCATPASRPASAARPAPPARTRAGIFRVHQFDKVEMFSFVAAAGLRRRARADPRDRGGDPAASSGCPTASSTSPSAISAARRRRSTTARRGCRARAATAS